MNDDGFSAGAGALVSLQQITQYLDMLFGYVDWGDGDEIRMRGLGEKGTPKEGVHREKAILTPNPMMYQAAFHHATRWAQHSIGTFIVPAVMTGGDDKEVNVRLFTTLLADIDSGDTDAKLEHASLYLGRPSMVVQSGGVTETGQFKLHVYWQLTEPTEEIERVARLRHALALKIGADPSFQRWPQIIRIPGTVHGKNGKASPCKIIDSSPVTEYDLDDLAESIEIMPRMPGLPVPAPKAGPMLDFGAAGGWKASQVSDALNRPVHEGAIDERTRWDAFNTVAGGYIRQAREGVIELPAAAEMAFGWMQSRMVPPWPRDRFEQEFAGLIKRDRETNGAFPTAPKLELAAPVLEREVVMPAPGENGLFAWAVERWARGERPKRRFLVDGLIRAAQQHLFVAEGGAGKTFLVLDLAVKIATYQDGLTVEWCGKQLRDGCGGTVVILTTEDDQEELHIRLDEIDPHGLRFKAGEKLIVVPLINAGGAFPLCERDRAGNVHPSGRWQQAVEMLRGISDLRLVVIDTFNATMHGNENDATTINEYAAALNIIPGQLRAAVIVTHHTRKSDEPITTADQMASAVRGSSAISAAFRVVIGIWPSSDYARRLKAMGKPPVRGVLFHLAITKANNPEMMRETRTLVRQQSGLLVDATQADRFHNVQDGARAMWLLKAFEMAAAADHAYTRDGSGANSPYKRKHELPGPLQEMRRRELEELTDFLLETGLCVTGNMPGSSTKNAIDVKGGILAMGQAQKRDGAYQPPDWGKFKHDPLSGYIVEVGT